MIDGERTRTEEIGDKQPQTGSEDRDVVARKPQNEVKKGSSPRPLTKEDAELGAALRSVYQQTVDEAVPKEMLDLLKRLD
ncbi:MAG: NepR family anti-sigma factor [Sphingobium sp.]